MVNLLNKRLLRDISKNKKNYISLICITILSMTLFIGLFANYHYFKENLDDIYKKSNVADIYVTQSKLDNSKYSYLNNNKEEFNIKKMEKRVYSDAYVNEKKVYLVSVSNDSTISIPSNIIEGSSGVMINKTITDRLDLKVGDTFNLNLKMSLKQIIQDDDVASVLSSSLKEGKKDLYTLPEINIEFRLTGIMNHAEALGNLASSSGIIYMSQNTLKQRVLEIIDETYNLSNHYNFLFSKVLNTTDLSNQIVIKGGDYEKIRNYYNDDSTLMVSMRSLMPGSGSVEADVRQAKTLCFVFPIVFYVVSILIIITTILKEIKQDKKSIGLFSALGYSKNEIRWYYIKEFLIVVLIGVILGIIIGPMLIPKIMSIKYNMLYNIPSTRHHIFYIEYLMGILFIILATIFITLFAINKYLKNNIKDILTSKEDKKMKHSLLEHLSIFKHLSFPIKMSIRNIGNNILRSILVVIGVMGCTSLLVCGFGINNTLNYGLNLELYEKIKYDIEITYTKGNIDLDDFYKKYSDNIQYIEGYQYNVVVAEHEGFISDTTMTIINDDSICYNINCNNDGVTISKKIAETLGVKVGDNINLHYSNNIYNLKVSNVVSMFMSQGIYMTKSYCPFESIDNRAFLNVFEDVDINLFASRIEEENDTINNVNTITSRLNRAFEAMSSLNIITTTICVFAILLALVVIYNLSMLNFKERLKEISTLRVLGYGYIDLSKMLCYEILILTFLGSVLGTMIGYPFLYAVLSLNEPSQISYIYKINISSYIYSILLTFFVSIIINLFISLKARKVKMIKY